MFAGAKVLPFWVKRPGRHCPQSSKTVAGTDCTLAPHGDQRPVGRGDIWPTELILGHCPSTAPGDRVRLSLQCMWPVAGFCTAGTLTYLQFCHLPPRPLGWSLPAIPHDTPVAGLNVPGEGLMCLRILTELPSGLHGTKVCVGRIKGEGCLTIASGAPTSVLRHLRQGHCVLSLSFLIWRMGMTPRPKAKAWGGIPGPRLSKGF